MLNLPIPVIYFSGLPVDEDSARAWLNKAEALGDDQIYESYKLENMESYYTLQQKSTARTENVAISNGKFLLFVSKTALHSISPVYLPFCLSICLSNCWSVSLKLVI